MIKLIIFDVDDTLVETYTSNLLPRVKAFFQLAFQAGCPKIALATNQGGVGMRYWMEKGGFGNPEKYPTQEEIEVRLKSIVTALGGDSRVPVYTSYRYRTQEGDWSPVPEKAAKSPNWSVEWRKPQPGMLLQAMAEAEAAPDETLFVGDSLDDQQAAQAAGCGFAWAKDFFSRQWTDCEQLKKLTY